MLTGFVTLAGTLLGILFWMMKRRAVKEDDPAQQNRKRYEQIDQDIAKGDSVAATGHATADLDELDRVQRDRANH